VATSKTAKRRAAEKRTEEATVIQWTLRGKQAENAAVCLGQGVNIVGRLKNNNDQKARQDIFGWTFTGEETDRLDTRAVGETRRDGLAVEAVQALSAWFQPHLATAHDNIPPPPPCNPLRWTDMVNLWAVPACFCFQPCCTPMQACGCCPR
jgi:hypothetical protein